MYNSTKCIKCRACEKVCEREVHKFINSKHLIDRNKCNVCGKCIEFCPENAVEICGKIMSAEEVIEVVKRDKIFYDNSGGGMTISGGEPLVQKKFTLGLLVGAKLSGINTIIDTNGHGNWDDIKEILPYTDGFRYDLKIMNNDIHKLYTGVGNKLILENLGKLSRTNKDIVITIPLIKDINDSVENIGAIVIFLKSLKKVPKVQILPCHSLHVSKLKKLERSFTLFSTPGCKDIEKIIKIFTSEGIEIYSN
jgi:pyruvate formate lyase activating enzyme